MFYILEHVYSVVAGFVVAVIIVTLAVIVISTTIIVPWYLQTLCNYVHHIAVWVLVLIIFIPSHPYNCMHPPHELRQRIKLSRDHHYQKEKTHKNDKNRLFQHRSLEPSRHRYLPKTLHSIKPHTHPALMRKPDRGMRRTGDLYFKMEGVLGSRRCFICFRCNSYQRVCQHIPNNHVLCEIKQLPTTFLWCTFFHKDS